MPSCVIPGFLDDRIGFKAFNSMLNQRDVLGSSDVLAMRNLIENWRRLNGSHHDLILAQAFGTGHERRR